MNHWVSAVRARTLPLAVASIGMGGFLAAAAGQFNFQVFVMCLLTTMALQILSNLANDYGDSVHGADNSARKGPSRAVQSGLISHKKMKLAIGVTAVITLILGISLLMMSQLSTLELYVFLALGVLAITAAILYTNGFIPYGYIGLGDISVFIFFGMLGVIGSNYLMTGSFSWDLILPGASCGLFTVAVLNINNIRDIDSDKVAGKYSIPVRLGYEKSIYYHYFLLIIGLLCAVAYVTINYRTPLQFLFLLATPLLIVNAQAVKNKLRVELDPYLKQMSLTTLLFVFLFGIGQL